MHRKSLGPARTRGFTLVEVLITIFVTGVGLLTVAGLQAASKKANFEAAQRTTAIALGQDMIERIRANSTVISSYLTSDATTVSAGTACDSSACIATDLAAFDVYQWGQKLLGAQEKDANNNLTGGLVSPTGCITYDSTRLVYRVVVAWRGYTALPAVPTSTSVVSSTDPTRDTCGTGLSRYGTSDALRRLVVLEFV